MYWQACSLSFRLCSPIFRTSFVLRAASESSRDVFSATSRNVNFNYTGGNVSKYSGSIQASGVMGNGGILPPETLGEKAYRWLDITGFLTRWNNRKEWIMDLDPYSRMGTVMITEFERKMIMFMAFHAYLFYIISMLAWWYAQTHFACKPPCPKPPEYPHLDGRKHDFTWHGKFYIIHPKERCKECRWLEPECKKKCFEKLKEEGHKFIINGGNPLSTPRQILESPHFH